MIVYKEGNLLDSNLPVIAHQTNGKGVMGAGIAAQIKKRFPEVFYRYQEYCMEMYSRTIGTCFCVPTTVFGMQDTGIQYVANLFGQNAFGNRPSPFPDGRHTDYMALRHALECLIVWMRDEGFHEVGIPYKIGCGNGGGDWDNEVLPLLKRLFEKDTSITLYIYKYQS